MAAVKGLLGVVPNWFRGGSELLRKRAVVLWFPPLRGNRNHCENQLTHQNEGGWFRG